MKDVKEPVMLCFNDVFAYHTPEKEVTESCLSSTFHVNNKGNLICSKCYKKYTPKDLVRSNNGRRATK